MMIQLNPSIPVETPKGNGQATVLLDYSPEHDLYWVVFLDDSRECWTFGNRDIRAQPNLTIGRGKLPPSVSWAPLPIKQTTNVRPGA